MTGGGDGERDEDGFPTRGAHVAFGHDRSPVSPPLSLSGPPTSIHAGHPHAIDPSHPGQHSASAPPITVANPPRTTSRTAPPPASETFDGRPPLHVAHTLPKLTVRGLVEDQALGVSLVTLAGEAGLERPIQHPRIQKSGLALVGHFHGIVPTRVQILGQTELSFLQRLSAEERRRYLRGFFQLGLSCLILTQGGRPAMEDGGGVMPVPELVQCAEEADTPLLLSNERSSVTINALHALLDERLAPRVRLHGVLVDVFGVGLLLMGPSAIGKSETALDLVMRGHRLVADDAVECDYRPPGMVFGAAAELLRHHLEVRGLGILNIKDLYGVTAIRERKRIDVVVRLVDWIKDAEFDRLGLDDHFHEILGVKIRELVIPVRPGRDMASIVEVAARNELLRTAGHHAARDFFGALEGALLGNERPNDESGLPPPVQATHGPQGPASQAGQVGHVGQARRPMAGARQAPPPPPSSGAALPRRLYEPEARRTLVAFPSELASELPSSSPLSSPVPGRAPHVPSTNPTGREPGTKG